MYSSFSSAEIEEVEEEEAVIEEVEEEEAVKLSTKITQATTIKL